MLQILAKIHKELEGYVEVESLKISKHVHIKYLTQKTVRKVFVKYFVSKWYNNRYCPRLLQRGCRLLHNSDASVDFRRLFVPKIIRLPSHQMYQKNPFTNSGLSTKYH